jgi:DNA-binding transcriptional LysR family regulator
VIDLRHMRYTIAAADYRSLRRAAEAMHLKQSTLSRCVRELEDELQVTLFVRSRAGVRPTAAGAAFITSVRRVVQEIEGIAAMARAAGRGEVGRITIGFYTSLSTGNLRATLLDYIERFPKVEIGILQGSRAEQAGAVVDAKAPGDAVAFKSWLRQISHSVHERRLLGRAVPHSGRIRSPTYGAHSMLGGRGEVVR